MERWNNIKKKKKEIPTESAHPFFFPETYAQIKGMYHNFASSSHPLTQDPSELFKK